MIEDPKLPPTPLPEETPVETPAATVATDDGRKPTNVLTSEGRTYTLEGPREVIEDTNFQILAMNTFKTANDGVYKLNGNKVTVATL